MALQRVIVVPTFFQTWFTGRGPVPPQFNAAQLTCGFDTTSGDAYWALAATIVTDLTQVISGPFTVSATTLNSSLDPATPADQPDTSLTMAWFISEEFPFQGWGPGIDRVPGAATAFIETQISDPFTITDLDYEAGLLLEIPGSFSNPLSDAFFRAGASQAFRGPSMNSVVGLSLHPVSQLNPNPGNQCAIICSILAPLEPVLTADVIPELTGLDGLEYARGQSRVDRCPKCGIPSLRETWVLDGWSKHLVCPHCWDPVDREENRQPVLPEDDQGINPTG